MTVFIGSELSVEKIAAKKFQAYSGKGFNHIAFLNKIIFRVEKKMMDILFSLIGLLVSIPIIFIVGILIRLETEGPIIYTQQRAGKDGHLFMMYKLRTMYHNAEAEGARWAQINDSRVTKVGRFLRKTRIDELPQFINVLKGEMSIVGPRPERPYFITEFSREIPEFSKRLAVKPGLTGWSQINGGYDLSPAEKLEKDLFYIENQSILLDMKIILKTVRVVMTFEGAR